MATLALIESWTQSTGMCLPPLIRELGHHYVLFTRDPSLYPPVRGEAHPVLREAAEVVLVNTNDLQALAAAVTTSARRRRFDGVLTTCDYYLETAASLAGLLGLPGPPPAAVRAAVDKHEVRAAMRRAGLPGPAFALATSWPQARAAAAAIGFPLVAKPVDLNSGTSVRRVDDEAGLKDAFWEVVSVERNSRGQPLRRVLLLEELLDGPEVSVEAVTRAGLTTIIGITGKQVTAAPAFVEAGHEFPARLDREVARDVENLTRPTIDAVGYTHGLSHTEMRLTADGPRLVELNPRQAGGYIFDLVSMVTGTHPLEVLVDLALGQTPRLGVVDAPLTATATATATPPVASAAVSFVMSPASGRLRAVEGVERLTADPAVRRWEVDAVGQVERPRDNNARLGYVLTADECGPDALAKARSAVGGLRLRMEDGGALAPLGH